MKAKQSSTSTSPSHLYGSNVLLQSMSSQVHASSGNHSSITLFNNQQQQPRTHLIHPSHQHVNDGIESENGAFGCSKSSNNSSTSLYVQPSRAQISASGLGATNNTIRHHQYHHCNNIVTSTPTVPIDNLERSRISGVNYCSFTPSVHLNPMLTKADSIDIFDSKKLERGISRATENVTLVSRARQEFEMDFHAQINTQNDKNLNFIDTPDYTFTLPDLTKYTDDFRKFLEKDLIESSTLNTLEATNRLNWWHESAACSKLWPLATTGDGNCLLHAASLAMWGFHDRRLTLRRTLHDILSKEDFRDALYRRWRFQQTRVNKQAGFVFCENEWAKEWEEIVAIASPEPRRNSKSTEPSRRRSLLIEKSFDAIACGSSSIGVDDETATYESLEEIHVLALAHILRRTIIVVSDVFLRDVNGEAFSPIPFGGVYLPFEVPSNECHRAPLLLAYDMAHFSALVAMETPNDSPPALIPLVDATNQLLPIQFCIDPGKDFNWNDYDGSHGNWTLTDREHIALLKEYLEVVHATGIESPDDEIYFDDYSDDEYEKKIGDGEIVLAADENYNNNIGIVASSMPVTANAVTGTLNPATTAATSVGPTSCASSMTASNQSLLGGSSGKETGGKSKAAKQLQSVAKQFGSIGKSMSRKFRKNIGSITRIGSKHSGSAGSSKKTQPHDKSSFRGDYPRFRILCAQLKSRRHEYQEEMIKNYLECAQERYLETEKQRKGKEMESLTKYVEEVGHQLEYHEDAGYGLINLPEADGGGLVNCINVGCLNYGTAATSFMCLECYEMQRKRETNCNSGIEHSNAMTGYTLRYGTGKSKFYTEADMEAHDRIQNLPAAKRLNDLDQTLYLSRSTFYNDTKLQDIHGVTYQQVTTSAMLEQSAASEAPSRQNSHSQHHLHQHHHYHGRGGADVGENMTTKPPQCTLVLNTQHPAPFTECSNSAKPLIGPSSVSLTSNIGNSGNVSQSTANMPYNRATALCVVNLPPDSDKKDCSSCKGQIINIANDTSQSLGSSSSGITDVSRLSHQPFSSSSSSSSIGGCSGLQTTSTTVNSSHHDKNQLCRTDGCKFYGSISTNFYCSKCGPEHNI